MISPIFKAIGILVALSIVPCVVLIIRKHLTLRGAELCSGTVSGYEERNGSDGPTYALVIEYKDSNSVPRRFVTGSSSSPAARDVGDDVVVFHYRDNAKPDIMVFEHLFLGYWIWLCVSVCAIGCLWAPKLMEQLYLK